LLIAGSAGTGKSILAGNFGLHRRTIVKGQPDISLKCHDAVYPRFWAYNVFMSFPPPLSLHHYFVVAARMRHHFESNLVAVMDGDFDEKTGRATWNVYVPAGSR
jgi:hypothetical protein